MYLTIIYLDLIMVSIQEILQQRRTELSSFEQSLEEQRQRISTQEVRVSEEERRIVEETTPLPLTTKRQFLLAGEVGAGGVQERAKQIKQEKKTLRARGLSQISLARKQLKESRQQVISESARADPLRTEISKAEQFQRGEQLALTGRSPLGLETEQERAGFQFGIGEQKFFTQQTELFKIGTPVFTGGKLTGFETGLQTVPISGLELEQLQSLERGGVIDLKFEAPTPSGDLFTPLPERETIRERAVRGLRTTFGLEPLPPGVPGGGVGTQLQSALFLSLAGVKVPLKPITKIPLRRVRDPFFTEFQQPVVLPSGKQIVISKFEITTEVRPPTLVQTREGGLLFGRVEPLKLERTISFPSLEGTPVTTLTTRGGRVGQLDILTGTARPVSPEAISGLPRVDQFLFQRTAELGTGGRPVKLDFVPRVLKGREFDLGELTSFKLGRVDVGTRPSTLDLLPTRQAGRRTTRFETLSEFRQIGTTPELDIFGGRVLFKETTKPLARARGRTPELPGIVFRVREPIVLGDDLGVQVLRPVGGRKTPLSKTFQQEITTQLDFQSPKPIPKARRPRAALKTAEPSPVGGIVGLSSRSISGQLGRITDFDSGFVSDFGRGFERGLSPFQQRETVRTGRERDQFETGRLVPRIDVLGLERVGTGFKFDIGQRFETRLDVRLDTKLAQKFETKLLTRTQQRQKLSQRQKLATKQLTLQELRPPRRGARGRIPRARGEPTISPLAFKLPRLSFFEEGIGVGERKRARQRIAPSFTGIVLEIEAPATPTKIFGRDIGILPTQIRGLRTGF